MSFESFAPQNEILKKYIYYFYFDKSDDADYYKKFSYYPHVNTTLTFYKNAFLSVDSGISYFKYIKNDSLIKMLTRQHSIRTVVHSGKLDKIGIVFHPLGFNHFINETYSTLAKKDVQHFLPSNNDLWNDAIMNCFSISESQKRIEMLENFLMSLYKPIEFKTLKPIIKILNDPHNILSIRQIASENQLCHRKLIRDFKRALCITPVMFRMITRFRYAVNQKILFNTEDNFTELGYESGYFDQSYMIKTFKKFTGLSPSDFFKSGSHLGMADTFWKLDKLKTVK